MIQRNKNNSLYQQDQTVILQEATIYTYFVKNKNYQVFNVVYLFNIKKLALK